MMLPPATMRLRIVEGGRKKIGLWLPIFLLWPLLLVVVLLAVPLYLVLLLVSPFVPKANKVVKAIPAIYSVICALKGLTVDVKDENENVLIKID